MTNKIDELERRMIRASCLAAAAVITPRGVDGIALAGETLRCAVLFARWIITGRDNFATERPRRRRRNAKRKRAKL